MFPIVYKNHHSVSNFPTISVPYCDFSFPLQAQEFEKALGSKDKANETIYSIGWQGGYYEVGESLKNGLWGPKSLTRKIGTIELLDEVRTNPDINRLMTLTIKMVHLKLKMNQTALVVSSVYAV